MAHARWGWNSTSIQLPGAGPEDAEVPVNNAEIVRSLFEDVTFDKAKTRVEELLESGAVGDNGDQLAAEMEKISALDKPDEEKAEALAFAVIDAVDIEFLKDHFQGLN